MFRPFLASVEIRICHDVCLGVGRGCGAAFGNKGYWRVFAVGVEEEVSKRGAKECAVYAPIPARGGCVDVVAVWAVKFNCVHTGHVRAATRDESGRGAIDAKTAAEDPIFVSFGLGAGVSEIRTVNCEYSYHRLQSGPRKNIALVDQAIEELSGSFDD